MSVQSQIDRINAAKADILAALTEKGVDTSGAGLADIAALVAGIQAGGGSGERVKVTRGDITPGSDSYEMTIEHGLGCIPQLFVLYKWDGYNSNGSVVCFEYDWIEKRAYLKKYFANQGRVDTLSGSVNEDGTGTFVPGITANAITFQGKWGTSLSYFLKGGVPYRWCAAGA